MTIAAFIFIGISLIVIAFQIAVAFGAPWGEYTMGGGHQGKLPLGLRIGAGIQAGMILFFDLVVLIRAGLILPQMESFSRILIWIVVGFFVLGSILNIITTSKKERVLWAPVNIVMLGLSLFIALS